MKNYKQQILFGNISLIITKYFLPNPKIEHFVTLYRDKLTKTLHQLRNASHTLISINLTHLTISFKYIITFSRFQSIEGSSTEEVPRSDVKHINQFR